MYYVKQGSIPSKRHIAFKKPDGTLFREELFSTHGFSHVYSNKYHYNMPTVIKNIKAKATQNCEQWENDLVQNYKFHTARSSSEGNFMEARTKYLFNDSVSLYTAKVTQNTEKLYRNMYDNEVLFIHSGSGVLSCDYGDIVFKKWDYLVIPKGIIYNLRFDDLSDVRLFIIESKPMIEIPKHFLNPYGQLKEDAPFSERDIRHPVLQKPIVEEGEFNVLNKLGDKFQITALKYHPFDLEGWDGCHYPFAFNLDDYAPLVGKIHLPPSSHLLFTTSDFVICNFVPRLFDFHPEAIPAPYFHSNIDSDEVLYYVHGEFMSRTGIEEGSMTLHQAGLPHGPQPGKTEESIGKKSTYEYAVMVDTFSPLKLTKNVMKVLDEDYIYSWDEN